MIVLILSGCEKFSYSPYAHNPENNISNVNTKSIERLLGNSNSNSDTISFALVGDIHNYYNQTRAIVKAVNLSENIDFVIQDGDITDFGTEEEMIKNNGILAKLKVPYFTVIGNHDCIANGKTMHEIIFGAPDFSFIFNRVKFIFINTNSQEYNFDGSVPNINWLENELNDSLNFDNAVVICHIPPTDNGFDGDLSDKFISLLNDNPKVLLELNGHLHDHKISKIENITYINSSSVDRKSYFKISIWKDNFSYKLIHI